MAGVVIGYSGIQAGAIMEGLQRLRSCFEGSA
jgi:hypothetical protein